MSIGENGILENVVMGISDLFNVELFSLNDQNLSTSADLGIPCWNIVL